MPEKRVLSIGVEKDSLSSVSADLDTEEHAVESVPTARSALHLLSELRFDLVVLAHPQPDLVMREFIDELRDRTSASSDAKLLVLTDNTEHPELQNLRAHGLEIISRDASLIGDLTTKVLGGKPRHQISVIVRLEADLPYGRSKRICQSENLSVSGMLLRTEDTLPVDTRVLTSFSLPNTKEPIEVTARVVRLTGPGEIPGIALNFEGLKEGDRALIEELLAVLGK